MKLAIFQWIERREAGVQVSVLKISCRYIDLDRQDFNYKKRLLPIMLLQFN